MPSFEEQLKVLETVVEKLERGDMPLDESLALFEQGIAVSEACKQELAAAEGRVQVLLQRGRGRVAEDLELQASE